MKEAGKRSLLSFYFLLCFLLLLVLFFFEHFGEHVFLGCEYVRVRAAIFITFIIEDVVLDLDAIQLIAVIIILISGTLGHDDALEGQDLTFVPHVAPILLEWNSGSAFIVLATEEQRVVDALLSLVERAHPGGAALLIALLPILLNLLHVDALLAHKIAARVAFDGIDNDAVAEHACELLNDFSAEGAAIHIIGDIENNGLILLLLSLFLHVF